MKYFSINCVKNAYQLVSANTKDKFWGILGILYSIDSVARPGVNFSINTERLSTFLEQTFRLKDKKVYNSPSSVYSVVFANDWETKIANKFISNTPNILPITIWAYRGYFFENELSAKELLEKFVNDFHISKESIEYFFNTSFDSFLIEYSDTAYNDEDLFKELGGTIGSDLTTIKMNKSFVVANAGDLSRGPFFQPLYASLNTLECLIIFPFDAKEYYQVFNASEQKRIRELSVRANQIIYYGAPGTGKSHKIKEQLVGVPKENVFRTTFHPDSDYSTFVGAYKPTMEKTEEQLYNKEELISKLTELKEQGVTYSPQKFGAKYWRSLKLLTLQDKKDILTACDMSDNYTVEFDKGIAVGEELLKKTKGSRIVYSFIPQAFLNAYIQSYRTTENVYLIIEEINRGNCAQIFGDLFQLLDRDENGVSEYCIKADADLRAYLEKELGADSDAIKDGELCLPSNLYIYATMNTSDQSLFPIDSAFKRRWDWEYEPIKYKNIDWVIDINGSKYSWVSFQREVNKRIFEANSSEDKMLGDYFVNPNNGIITEKILLNKILFYLWNDVCKDGEGDIFKISETTDICFSDLHGEGGSEKLVSMMKYLGMSLEDNTIEENLDTEQLDQESKTWYLNLWTDVRKCLENNGQENLPNVRDRQTYQLSVGLTGISVLANISKTKANGFVGYYIEKQQANDIYPKLLNLKDTIENSLGGLEWHREGNKYGIAKRNIELTNLSESSARNELIKQISKLIVDFKATIIPFVDQLR